MERLPAWVLNDMINDDIRTHIQQEIHNFITQNPHKWF